MEFRLTGNALKTFARSVTCLARIGNEVTLQASPSQLVLHTLNSSRSAYESITLKPAFFDVYTVSGDQVLCSVLLKAVCSVLRTPVTSIDHLSVLLPDPDASKVQWTLDCYNGMKKTYWITCNVEADVQQLSLDKSRLPSSFVVRPRDLNRLLANFQSTLHEITVIATEAPTSGSDEVGGKAVELRSYVDPTKENDSSLHTQLWIDPCEEFVQYTHTGDPVDVTFGVKELKAFLSFCEGCEVDIHLYFEKAGEPILMAPKFGVDGDEGSNFDATLVLATMLVSQLHNTSREPMQQQQQQVEEDSDRPTKQPNPSDHTRIWSELSASATKSAATGPSGVVEQQQQRERERDDLNRINNQQRISRMNISKDPTNNNYQREDVEERQDGAEISQRHVSNWVDADEEEEDDDEDAEPFVQATPPYSTYS